MILRNFQGNERVGLENISQEKLKERGQARLPNPELTKLELVWPG